MSRTTAALVQDLLFGPELPLLDPLESSRRNGHPMYLFMVQQGPDQLSGVLSDRTGISVRLKQNTHPHSWVLMDHENGNLSFSCDCGSYCAISFKAPIIAHEALVPDRIKAANVLRSYLTNALNHDPRVVNISEQTSARLNLDILAQFGWEFTETCWVPPEQPDEHLYATAIRELDYIIASGAQQVLDNTQALYQFFGIPYIPYVKTTAQKLLGTARGDDDELVYSQYISQISRDPKNTPYYFDALQQMASESEFLQMRFMEQESLGVVSLSHIKTAYQDFGLNIDDLVDEDTLIGIFAREPRRFYRSLAIIADHRDSDRLRRLAATVIMTYYDAMRTLGVDGSSSETLVGSRARALHGSSDIVLKYEGQYALLQIASNRKSFPLLALYEYLHPPEPVTRDPYDYFGIGPTLDDDNVVAAYELIAQDEAPERQIELRTHLRAIAEARNSKRLFAYLDTGLLDEDSEASLLPVGLWNIGNTCYLNSLLQFYNTIVPFREALVHLDAQKDDTSIAKKKVGGRLVPYAEVARSQKFLIALNSLFKEMETTKDRFVTPTEELAYMALVPPREDVVEIETVLEVPKEVPIEADSTMTDSMDTKSDTDKDNDTLVEIESELHEEPHEISPEPHEEPVDVAGESLSTEMPDTEATADSDIASTAVLALPSAEEDAEAKYKQKLHQALERQQDVTECIENVLYQVEAGVNAKGYDEDGEQQDLVKDLFYGNIVQTLQNDSGSDKRIKHERVSSIMVNVADGPQHIHTALEAYFAAERMELSEGIFERTVGLSHTPPILQIQVQRVQFNRNTYELFKNNNPLILDQTLYMDRYLQTDDPVIIEKRKERLRLQERKAHLESKLVTLKAPQHNNCSREANLVKCAEWIESYLKDHEDEDQTVAKALEEVQNVIGIVRKEISEAESELTEIDETLKDQFSSYRKHGYRLHSLFIHRGQASHGHYWIYIKDFERNQFLKYNDETVTVVQESDVFDYSPGNTATPYFIVYIREDYVDYVKSINRDVPIEEYEMVTGLSSETKQKPTGTVEEDPFADGMSIENPIDLVTPTPPPSRPVPPAPQLDDDSKDKELLEDSAIESSIEFKS